MTKNTKEPLKFPANLLKPVYYFLNAKLQVLQKQKKRVTKADPFKDMTRVDEYAAPDVEADEQFGHERSTALSKSITRRIVEVKKALSSVKLGKYGICEECGQMIDTDRLIAFPEATLCAKDARKREK